MNETLSSAPEWFPFALACFYLFAKIVLKGFIKVVVGVRYDVLDTSAWFPVDLLVLVLSASISYDLSGQFVVAKHERAAWYGVLTFILIVVWGMYGLFSRFQKEKKTGAAVAVTILNLVLGLGPVIVTLSHFGGENA